MARKPPEPPKLPPPSRAACWAEFLKWALGVPLVVLGGLGIIGGALWLTGGQEMAWQATANMGTALFWMAAIALMYPAMLVVWMLELQAGLRAAKDWDAMSDADRTAALAAPMQKGR